MAQKSKQMPAAMAKTAARRRPPAGGGGAAGASARPAPVEFIDALYANVMAADLAAMSRDDRARLAGSIWALAQERKAHTLKLRLFNPSLATDGWSVDHTVLETVHDDMPFLVDSITGAIQRRGLMVHQVIHPVLQVQRDAAGRALEITADVSRLAGHAVRAESMMHVQFDHCLDPVMLKEIEADIRAVFADARSVVEDWPQMRRRMHEALDQATASKHQKDAAENTEEVRAFMRWIDDNNFTYLGYRDIDLMQEAGKLKSIKVVPGSGLGILRDQEKRMFGGLRDLGAVQNPTLQMYVRQHHLLVVTKTNVPSRVHRQVPMDALFIRRFDTDGNIIGERLFVGLFTSQSYAQNPQEIPFLRRKIEHVVAKANFRPSSHDGKSLVHILNDYPHDELLQIGEDELYANTLGILQLQERAKVAVFTRRDPFGRFVTCLIYVPRDQYDSSLRLRFQAYLERSFGGEAEDWHVRIDDSLMARAFVTIRLTSSSLQPDLAKVERDLREMCRGWLTRLRDHLVTAYGEAPALALLRRYGNAFPVGYRDATNPAAALQDIQSIERGTALLDAGLIVELAPLDAAGALHLKLFQAGKAMTLSEVLPLIENTGLKVDYTGGPYEITPNEGDRSIFIHEFVGKPAAALVVPFERIKPVFEEAFANIWSGEVENDAFNGLMLRAGMHWREIVLLRAFARYLRQLRIPYSNAMIAATFIAHPELARQIYALFHARHSPDKSATIKGTASASKQGGQSREIEAELLASLAKIDVLEEDRVIRRYLNLVQSSLRTNYFQVGADGKPKPYLSIKFDSRAVEFMPLPKPLYEIFVYSPRVEAVHLRGGKVARGGIRWSDRREDFRNEILGLMKAQMVKNSVIVPVGSKGGFIVKRPVLEADKAQAEGIACYRIMMCGLLDITDNRVNGKIVPPPRVVRHDGDDPYLVVAADKGTAKFSDIANGISQEYRFWLDDAFASGGSAGYDHKAMGITARGAWEAVKRHFRELGKDIQTTDFTVVGVGDMSGDVFGNGMLLSNHTRLLGAFDHRHIFIDPSPDTAASLAERQRLFDLPRSSWADYDAGKISKGGGIFPRNAKSIKLTPEIKKLFGLTVDSLTPAELIQAMLRAEVELLYFGGIGTYVKASSESNDEVGDRATESLRIDGNELRAKVVGEGANLGLTQRGRVEYALRGGRINTDAIDNSAGVDTSDHEVNIKILLRQAVDKGSLALTARNKLLESMTNDVGLLVLRDNYMQTQALTIMEARAAELLPFYVSSMHQLEKSGLLNPVIEYLPDSIELAERQRSARGLTRPELAVLLAYAKIWLYQHILDSELPDDAYLQLELVQYFPKGVQVKYAKDIAQHQLSREIIATSVTNTIINRTGSPFVMGMAERTGRDPVAVTRAYLLAREAFGLNEVWAAIEALDTKVPTQAQTQMFLLIQALLVDAVNWFLTQIEEPRQLAPVMVSYAKGVDQLMGWLKNQPVDERAAKLAAGLAAQGVPASLAKRISLMPSLATALDLTRLVEQGSDFAAATEAYFAVGQRLGLDWLAEQARGLVTQTPWQREAVRVILDDFAAVQRRLTATIVMAGKRGKAKTAAGAGLAGWLDKNAERLERFDALLMEWRALGALDIAMLTLASRQLIQIAERRG